MARMCAPVALAILARSAFAGAFAAARQTATCAATDTPAVCEETLQSMYAAQVNHQPEEIISRHVVLFSPTAPNSKGGEIAAEAYMSLPRSRALAGSGPITVFTKVALVGHGNAGPKGISLGYDVCERAGIVDEAAVQFVRDAAMGHMQGVGPQVLDCEMIMPPNMPPLCPNKRSASLESQLPYIHNVLAEGQLEGNLLPIMMQEQDEELAAAVGDMVARLVDSGGIWESERVLFVFGGDLSYRLFAADAINNDTRVTELITTQGTAATAAYFGQVRDGELWGGEAAIPRSFSTLLSAARAAEILSLRDHRVKTGTSGDYYTETDFDPEGRVDGYASVLFWADDRYAGYTMPPNPPASALVHSNKTRKTKALVLSNKTREAKALVHSNTTREAKVVQPHRQKLLRGQNLTTLF